MRTYTKPAQVAPTGKQTTASRNWGAVPDYAYEDRDGEGPGRDPTAEESADPKHTGSYLAKVVAEVGDGRDLPDKKPGPKTKGSRK